MKIRKIWFTNSCESGGISSSCKRGLVSLTSIRNGVFSRAVSFYGARPDLGFSRFSASEAFNYYRGECYFSKYFRYYTTNDSETKKKYCACGYL